MALGDSYRNGITSAERFSKLNALSHAKKDVISANGGTAFRVLFNFITPEVKGGLNLIVLFCEGLAVSVFSHFYGASTSPVKTTFFKSRFRVKLSTLGSGAHRISKKMDMEPIAVAMALL
jgi:hypothetical protein